jgi:hypothetical protein
MEGRVCRALAEFPQEFISKTRGGTSLYLFPVPEDRLVGLAFDGKPGSGGVADHPYHPGRILLKSFVRVTDGSDDVSLEVSHPTDVVYDGEVRNIIEKTIDRNVSPQGILRRRSKTVCPKDGPLRCLDLLKF